MTAQEINFSNFFETTLDGNVGASDTSITLSAAPTSNGTSAISAPFYLVIDPDSATNREVILVTASSGVTMSTVTRDVEGRHSPDISHADGTTVRMAVVGQMFVDVNDRVSTIMNSTGTAVNTSGLVKDEDAMTSNSATHLATQQSIKAYVDTEVAANKGASLGIVIALS